MANTLSEWPAFLGAVYAGAWIGVLYALFWLLRTALGNNKWADGALDALFYLLAGLIGAFAIIRINGGTPRAYLFLGMALGVAAVLRFVARPLKPSAQKMIDWCRKKLKKRPI
ncbi:MAG: spore cortex biosynthesis protein YabQ [Bacillota bacterium]